jgi:LacI family transcriptional regulator
MTAPKRARIQDVAEKAGVSSMTVSRVLSQHVKVSDAKRELVMQAVKALNYRPNVDARRLAGNKSYLIGLLYVDLDNSYMSKFLLSGLKSCRSSGHHLVVDQMDDDHDRSIASVQELLYVTQVDGLILLPPVCDDPKLLAALQSANARFVRIAPETQLNVSPYICMDDYQASFDLTQRLIRQGHTKIGHIIGNPNQGASRLRYEGYLNALSANAITVCPDFIEQGLFTYESGLAAAKKILSAVEKPTAIFAANDDMAAAVLSVAHMHGLAVPEALSIAGFDDGHMAVSVYPNLTTVRQPIQKMAELAVTIIASGKSLNEKDKDRDNYRNVLGFEIIERESTATIAE